jgi:hypothetical protein
MKEKRLTPIVSLSLLMTSVFPSNVTSNSDTPEWLNRTDIEVSTQQDANTRWLIETIQPLHQDSNNTYFVQGRLAHEDKDETYNLGFGYEV